MLHWIFFFFFPYKLLLHLLFSFFFLFSSANCCSICIYRTQASDGRLGGRHIFAIDGLDDTPQYSQSRRVERAEERRSPGKTLVIKIKKYKNYHNSIVS